MSEVKVLGLKSEAWAKIQRGCMKQHIDMEANKITTLWYFWNHCHLIKQFPPRVFRKSRSFSWIDYPYKCVLCKTTNRGTRYIYRKTATDTSYCCPSCFKSNTEKRLLEE